MAWIDGQVVPSHAAAIPIHDQSYLSGMGVFETIRAENGVPLFLDAHLKRLAESAACFDLQMPDPQVVSAGIRELLSVQKFKLARVRLTLSNSMGEDGIPFRTGGHSRVSAIAFPITPDRMRKFHVVTSPFRADGKNPLAGLKCTSYALHAHALCHARASGANETIMTDHRGDVIGCATANIFWIAGGEVFTPCTNRGCRDGVTRERVIRACGELGIRVRTAKAKPASLTAVEEIFITSAIRGVRSVTMLDGVEYPNGSVTRRIRDCLTRQSAREISRATSLRSPAGQ